MWIKENRAISMDVRGMGIVRCFGCSPHDVGNTLWWQHSRLGVFEYIGYLGHVHVLDRTQNVVIGCILEITQGNTQSREELLRLSVVERGNLGETVVGGMVHVGLLFGNHGRVGGMMLELRDIEGLRVGRRGRGGCDDGIEKGSRGLVAVRRQILGLWLGLRVGFLLFLSGLVEIIIPGAFLSRWFLRLNKCIVGLADGELECSLDVGRETRHLEYLGSASTRMRASAAILDSHSLPFMD